MLNNGAREEGFFKALICNGSEKNTIHHMDLNPDGITDRGYQKTKEELPIGDFADVKITDTLEYDLVGEPL